MTNVATLQDPTANIIWTFDWATRYPSATVTTATVTSPDTGVTIASKTVVGATVTVKVACPTVSRIHIVCHVVLSTGEDDQWTKVIDIKSR